MDWAVEDDMVDSLFCTTLTGRRGGHTPQEQKRPTLVRRWLSQTQALLGRVILGVCIPVSRLKVRSLVGLYTHSAFH